MDSCCSILFHNSFAELGYDQAYFIFQKSSDNPVLLNMNEIKAVKMVSPPIPGYSVQLALVVELIAREHLSSPVIKLMLKIDGRPFWGKESITTDYSLVQTWTKSLRLSLLCHIFWLINFTDRISIVLFLWHHN